MPPRQIGAFATQAALKATNDALTALSGNVPQYVSANRMHWADVVAAYPASAALRGKFALVDDLYGAKDGSLRCGTDGTNYYWEPNIPEHFSPMTVAANVTLTALGSPTIVPLSGTIGLGVTRTVTLSTANVWPGARKRINTTGVTSLLGTLTVLNGVTNLLNLLTNSTYDMAVDYSSGTPQWVRI